MGKYHSLTIFKYENPTGDIEKEYKNRFESPTVIKTNLRINTEIKGEIKGKSYLLFLLPINEVLKLESTIQENSRRIIDIMNSLPEIALDQFFNNTLVNEIVSTNEIEGVKTLNKEVVDAISNSDSSKKIRLKSFARMYKKIRNHENPEIKKLSDIRKIYNFLLEGEIPDDKLPDGKLFRNKSVRIGTDFSTVHKPKDNEDEISEDLNEWILFINSNDISPIFKVFIAHYFFENIHPFNDGNGRVGRYIACVYLGRKLDFLSAITFSNEINKNKKAYYNSFKEVTSPNNFGEITFFVLKMMEILASGQKDIISSMENKKRMLDFLAQFLKNEDQYDSLTKTLLFFYFQSFLFNHFDSGIEDRYIKKITKDYHWTDVRAKLDHLSDEKILKITKKSPLTRKITNEYIEKICK
ncbi:Fic family protein [Fructilactobacillus cliffordii]|uniref:Fic family protein n=1 Tax=Fructilactobacillus cliffordii TaxID=2940299 RepID=A0A9Q8ZRF2_9LACO|nr:Fic family protein [Fructilactobacillus cliffordii]USS89127.1 Fic family protein [Fructilactobacillus cliffordii]